MRRIIVVSLSLPAQFLLDGALALGGHGGALPMVMVIPSLFLSPPSLLPPSIGVHALILLSSPFYLRFAGAIFLIYAIGACLLGRGGRPRSQVYELNGLHLDFPH